MQVSATDVPGTNGSATQGRPQVGYRELRRIAVLWLGVLLLMLAVLYAFDVRMGAYLPSPQEGAVAPFGLDLGGFGLASRVSGAFYLHVFHLLVLGILSGQLFLAWSQEREEYLSWTLLTAVLLALAYLLYTVFALLPAGAELGSLPAGAEPGSANIARPRQPPAVLLKLLSLGSTLTLLLAGISARYELPSRLRLVKLAAGLIGPVLAVAAGLHIFNAQQHFVSAPVAAGSVAACVVCARSFARRAFGFSTLLAATLLVAFLAYGAVHFFEPLLYMATFEGRELVFLLSFVAKSVAFLAIVALALVESHSNLRASNDRLQKHEEDYLRLLHRTGFAHFQDSAEGRILRSLGEEKILGPTVAEGGRREDLFSDPSHYAAFMQRLGESEDPVEQVVEMKHSSGESRFASVRAKREQIDGVEIVGGFYHDVTASHLQGTIVRQYEALALQVTAAESAPKGLQAILEFLQEKVGARAEIYVAGPYAGASPEHRFLSLSYLVGEGRSTWPLVVGDGILGVLREQRLSEFADDGEEVSRALRSRFGVDGGQNLICVALGDLHRSAGVTEVGDVRGFAAFVIDGKACLEQRLQLETLATVGDELAFALELCLLRRVMADAEALWETAADRRTLQARLEDWLRTLVETSLLDAVFVIGETSAEGYRAGVAAPPTIGSSVAGPHPFLEALQTLIARDGAAVPARPTYSQSEAVGDGESWSWARLPLSTEESGPLGELVALRAAGGGELPAFARFDELYLKHLGAHLSSVVARAAADQSFRFVVARISHDVRAPINAIRNRAHWLQGNWKSLSLQAIQDKLEDIKNSGVELTILTGKLDHFKNAEEQPRPTMLFKDVVQKSCKELAYLFNDRDCSLPDAHYSYFTTVPLLLCRRSALERIVQNVLVNFAKYGRDEEHSRAPRVFAIRHRDYYVVSFQNWGPPIAPHEKEAIFEAHYRSESVRSKEVTGEGMGLFIARDLARQDLGGDLLLEHAGDPVEFRLLLPKRLAAPEGTRDG